MRIFTAAQRNLVPRRCVTFRFSSGCPFASRKQLPAKAEVPSVYTRVSTMLETIAPNPARPGFAFRERMKWLIAVVGFSGVTVLWTGWIVYYKQNIMFLNRTTSGVCPWLVRQEQHFNPSYNPHAADKAAAKAPESAMVTEVTAEAVEITPEVTCHEPTEVTEIKAERSAEDQPAVTDAEVETTTPETPAPNALSEDQVKQPADIQNNSSAEESPPALPATVENYPV